MSPGRPTVEALDEDVLGCIFGSLTPKERVGASLVCKAWLRAEAASPVRHTYLNVNKRVGWLLSWQRDTDRDVSRLRWELRDSSRLVRLELDSRHIATFLTLQPELTRLEYLTIQRWDFTYSQAEQLTCLQSLRNLQDLELFMIRPANEGPGSEGSCKGPDPEREAYKATCCKQAGLSLRKAVSKLPGLTCLNLCYVNFVAPGAESAALHPWTQLRKLLINNLISDTELCPIPAFHVAGLGDMTRLTELRIIVPFADAPEDLQRLTGLQRLALDYRPRHKHPTKATYYPFVFPEAATITKLSFTIGEEMGKLADVLPLRSLRHVKELEMVHLIYQQEWPFWQQWPSAWSRLSALTSLTCILDHHIDPHVPAVLNRMTSLRKLDVRHDFFMESEAADPEDGDYVQVAADNVINMTRGLTRLTSLVVDRQEWLEQHV